jgi:hypothetical protein
MVVYPDYAVVKVEVLIADKTDKQFQFTYNRNVKITGFEPPFGLYTEARSLIVKGNHFHPHLDMLCKYTIGTEITIPATYLTNKTVS